jgi:hypothetical protein
MEVVFVGTGDARRYGVLRYPVAQVLLDWRIGIAVAPLRSWWALGSTEYIQCWASVSQPKTNPRVKAQVVAAIFNPGANFRKLSAALRIHLLL